MESTVLLYECLYTSSEVRCQDLLELLFKLLRSVVWGTRQSCLSQLFKVSKIQLQQDSSLSLSWLDGAGCGGRGKGVDGSHHLH